MTKFTSNRQRSLDVGISNYTEGSEVLTVTGNTSISGIITATVGAAVTYYGDGSRLTGITASQVGGISNVVDDTTPQLGGDLDLNSNNITGTGNINITGSVTATSFSGDGSGLTGIITTSGPGSGLDADTLDNQQGTYYLDYNNFTNTPTIPTNNNQLTNGAGYITSADGGNADQLDGQEGTYYLNYNNFTNTPTIPTNNNQLTNGAGYITASDNISGTSGGLSGSPSITVTDITAVGSVSIAGTLSYVDVSSLDSVGLITARTGVRVITGGIEVSAGGAAITGVVTATSFSGDGSNITGITASQVGALADIVTDTTPQLGGNLDLNSNNITGTGNVNITGSVTATSFTGDGSGLTGITASQVGAISNIVTDTTPQLGGNLDLNSNNITGTGNINITGNISLSGTVDGRDVAADGSKLDGIESGATADQTASEILTALKTVDGSGSGLDADLLDGQQGSYYLNYNNFTNTPTIPTNNNQLTNGAGYVTSADGGNAATLDGLDSTQFLRSDAVDVKTSGVLRFSDSVSATFGNSNDLQIYHDASNSFIYNTTGSLYLRNTANDLDIVLQTDDGSGGLSNYVFCDGSSGAVYLYHYGSEKFRTTSTGILVTGAIAKSGGTSSQFLKADGSVDSSTYITSADGGNAATLDGLDSTQFLRSDASDTTTGNITISKSLPKLILDSPSSGDVWTSQGAQISLGESGDGGSAALHLTYRGDGYGYIGMGVLSNGIPPYSAIRFYYASNSIYFYSNPSIAGNTNWHSGNDGAGSGLDADTVDGQQGSYYLNYNNFTNTPTIPTSTSQLTNDSGFVTSADGGNAATLDSLDSTQFLRSDVADTQTGGITFNGGLTLGTSQVINHNASSSRDKIRVWNVGTYAIGMKNGFTFGAINNDYAMTFQMSNTNNRGWWWGDSSHTDAQGAMSLNTQGKLSVAHSLRLGYGESDTTVPGATYRLDVSGSAYVNGNISATGDINSSSDARLKDNIETLEGSLDKVKQLRGVEYDRIDLKNDGEKRYHQLGVIAQEIEKVYPDMVDEGENGMKTVSYQQLVPVLIEAVKELSSKVDEMKQRLDETEHSR